MHDADVIVIGGGIIGAATALDIARKSRLSVLLLEKTVCGSQASQSNFGNIRFYDWSQDQMPLAVRSRAIWENLEHHLGTDGEFYQTGSVRVTFQEKDLQGLADYMKTADGYDFGFELLNRERLRDRFPWLHGSTGAMWSPKDGTANPRLVAAAYGNACRTAGVHVHEQTEATNIEWQNGLFTVQTVDGGAYTSSQLVNAAGAWGNGIATQFDEEVSMKVMGPQLAVTEPVPQFVKSMISCFGNFYFRQTERGNIILGGLGRDVADAEKSRHSVLPDNTIGLYNRLLELVPALEGIRLIRSWSGIEGYLADMMPVISQSAKVPGLIHAFGFCGSGFQLGPGIGQTVSELVRNGRSDINLEAFRVDRPEIRPGLE